MASKVKDCLFIFISSYLMTTMSLGQSYGQTTIRGPPQAKQKEVKVIGRIGETLRLVCPVTAYPAPIVEWTKNGESVDFMWERYRTGRKSLKIKFANEDDTGVYRCKAVNGFGTEEVRVELIVVDPRKLPGGASGSGQIDGAPPVLTYETRASPLLHTALVGDTFKVSCEALGNPQPEIFWFKDGHHIDESVHFQKGKSTVEFSVLGTADAGVYTCRARNWMGEATQNYTLEVRQPLGATHAVVTDAGPADASVFVGEEASLQCRVKAPAPPHIKWLKRLEGQDVSLDNTLRVGQERYLILDANKDVSTGDDEYLNKLVIEKAAPGDAGMYICFVTNSGFGALTYRSMHLAVEERPGNAATPAVTPGRGGPGASEEPLPVLVVAVCLVVLVLLLLCVIVVWVLRKKRKEADPSTPSGSSPDVRSPFLVCDPSSGNPYPRLSASKPLPPAPWAATKVYPGRSGPPSSSAAAPTESSYADADPARDFDAATHQYEVPYAHLLPFCGASSGSGSCGSAAAPKPRPFLRSADCLIPTGNAYYDPEAGPVAVFSSDLSSYALEGAPPFRCRGDYDSQ